MSTKSPTVTHARVLSRIAEIDAVAWDACSGGDPFVSHAFLSALEETGCAVAEKGWSPRHLVIEDARGVVAVAPAYLKDHSYGEYVFDWAWADVYRRVGLDYYPKLQCCVPFTPATGPRLCVRSGEDPIALRPMLAAALVELARREGASSLHVTFPTEAETELGESLGLLRRAGIQYHWRNRGYASFDDFLGALLRRKRRQIARERRDACATLRIETLSGSAVRAEHWDAFHRFYADTIARKWGQAYLTRAFFEVLGQTMGERVVLFVAYDGDRIVAAALNLIGNDVLFGRYWGSSVEVPFLHFELCYYRAIEFAIARGLAKVEAGAQGEHKIARGYEPVETHSLHWIKDERLGAAIADFVGREREAVREELRALGAHSPFADARAVAGTEAFD